MARRIRVAVAGVGNNISALIQGIEYYKSARAEDATPGLARPSLGGYTVADLDFVVAFDVNQAKIGKPLNEAIFTPPNNYPRLEVDVPHLPAIVHPGPILDGVPAHLAEEFDTQESGITEEAVTRTLARSGADLLVYSLPAGAQNAAEFYARCALAARVGFVNCTSDVVARNLDLLRKFEVAGLPLIGDDLASHIGSSIVHKTLLKLFHDRGIDVESSFQLNIGGNMDFKNLTRQGGSKAASKKNALREVLRDSDSVEIIPSGGYIRSLGDQKVGVMKINGRGWAGAKVTLDVTLAVQDSSNAAGVIIDLIRIGALARDAGVGGFVDGAGYLLKSPPEGTTARSAERLENAVATLAAQAGDKRRRA